LSGSGVYDGSEIHESVLTLLAVDRAGAKAVCMAPNKNQAEVINHLSGQVARETRNVLVESARIARGQIRDVREVRASDLDALIIPGGFGTVKNLSDFVWKGENAWVDPDVYRLLRELAESRKPIGAICIAPAVAAKVFSSENPRLTIGTDKPTSQTLSRIGARPVDAQASEIVIDENLRLVTTPGYMLAERISQAASGIDKLVNAVVSMAHKSAADSAPSTVSRGRKSVRVAADSAASSVGRARRGNSRLSSRAARPQAGPRRRAVRA